MLGYLVASALLLLSPGPTNTLMAVAGAEGGLGRVRNLLLAEVAGYLTAILPLLAFGGFISHDWPQAALAIRLAMAGWVLFLAIKLWAMPAVGLRQNDVRIGRIYVTTVLNPKAWVFALVLIPGGGPDHVMQRLGLLVALIVAAALAWGAGGAALFGGDGKRRRAIRRAASVWLAVISATLAMQVTHA